MENIIAGKEYEIRHARKGVFRILVRDVGETVISGTIVAGRARYMSEPDRCAGDEIVLDLSHTFIEITPI